jgi:hypothetical protein
VIALLWLVGCPDFTTTSSTGGMWECWPEFQDQVVGGDGAVVVWVDSDAEGEVISTLYLNNYGTGGDCPVAVYQGSRPPDLADAPELVPGEAPPDHVDGLGDLVYAVLLAPESNQSVEWSGPMPIWVTVVGCEGLQVPGDIVNAPCSADVGPAQ